MARREILLMLYDMPDHEGHVVQLAKELCDFLNVELSQEMVAFVLHILIKCLADQTVISPTWGIYKTKISASLAARLREEHNNDLPPEYKQLSP